MSVPVFRNMKKYIFTTFLFILLAAVITENLYAEQKSTYNTLFIGNSLTTANNLPGMIQELAQARNHILRFSVYAPGGYKFYQHASDAVLLEKIKAGGWDFVILQEQSQMPGFSQMQLKKDVYPYAKKLVSYIRKYNPDVQIIFYMTMARKNGDPDNSHISKELGTYEGMQKRINKSYINMAKENRALVAPVGKVWLRLREEEPDLELYADNVHPNKTGSYVAACVFYRVIFDENSVGLPALKGVGQEVVRKIQSIVDEVVQSSRRVM